MGKRPLVVCLLLLVTACGDSSSECWEELALGYAELTDMAKSGRLDSAAARMSRRQISDLLDSCHGLPAHGEIVDSRLSELGANDFTLLDFATLANDVDLVERYLHRGFEVTGTPGMEAEHLWDGRTTLHLAAAFGSSDVIQVLLASGADPNARTAEGITPVMVASGLSETGRGAVELLLQSGADPDARDAKGRSVLFRAVEAYDPEKARILISRGAQFASADEKQTAISAINDRGDGDLVMLLQGASVQPMG
jgi:hypothetical protein